jgi:hypothetical protein
VGDKKLKAGCGTCNHYFEKACFNLTIFAWGCHPSDHDGISGLELEGHKNVWLIFGIAFDCVRSAGGHL